MPGYLQFGILGSPDIARGTIGAIGSDNAVIIYSKQHYESALEIKKYIEINQEKYRAPMSVTTEKSVAEQIREFKSLLDDGIITKEDFEEKKAQLLKG